MAGRGREEGGAKRRIGSGAARVDAAVRHARGLCDALRLTQTARNGAREYTPGYVGCSCV
eukprot:7388632-Prymnesium_polylepis.1